MEYMSEWTSRVWNLLASAVPSPSSAVITSFFLVVRSIRQFHV